MTKRVSLILVALMMIFTLFIGCTKKEEVSTSPESNVKDNVVSNDETTETVKTEPYTIDWYFIGNGPQADEKVVEEGINKHLAENTDLNVEVDLHPYDWGTYGDKMRTLLASGEDVDLFFSATWGSDIYENLRKGLLTDLTDLIAENAPNTYKTLSKGFLQGSAIKGRNYALPCHKEMATQKGVLLNKAMIDEFNFDISTIKKIEDLEPMLAIVKEKYPNDYPMEYQGPAVQNTITEGSWVNKTVVMSAGTENIVPVYDDQNAVHMFELGRKYYEAGYIRKDAATVKDMAPDRKTGRLFVIFEGLKPGKDVEVSNNYGIEYVQIAFGSPTVSTGETSGSMMAIPKSCTNPELVLKFYDLFYSDHVLLDILNYGIEGVHYVRQSENIISYTDEIDGAAYNPGTPWMFGDQFIASIFDNEAPDKWEKYREFNNAGVPLKTLGFVFDQSKVKNEVAACTNVYREFAPGLESGALDPDEYLPKYEEKLKAAGIETVVEEIKKQYEEWKASTK